jgi:hypothetical protein
MFVVEYGFNDFVNCVTKEEYATGLKKGLETLKKEYPEAGIILLSPLYTRNYEGGTVPIEKGCLKLTDCVGICKEVAKELELTAFIDLYHDSPVNAANADLMLADSVHPNVEGSYKIAVYLASQFSELSKE